MINIPQIKDHQNELIDNYRFLRFAKPVLNDEDFRDRCFEILQNIKRSNVQELEYLFYESKDLEFLIKYVKREVFDYFEKDSIQSELSPQVRSRTLNVVIGQLEKYIGHCENDYNFSSISINEYYKALVTSFEEGEVLDGIYDAVGVSKIVIEYISNLRDRHWSIYSNEYPKTAEFFQAQSLNYMDRVNLIKSCIRLLRQEIEFRTSYQKLDYLNKEFLLEIDCGEILESRTEELFVIHNALTKFLDGRGTSYDFNWG